MKKISVKETAQYGCLLAFAMMVSYVEVLLPIHLGIPGAKPGLANSVIVLGLYIFGPVPALIINVSRVVLSALLFTNLYSLWYSLAGALVSFAAMVICSKIKGLSIFGVSIAGGVFHNMGQLLIAICVTKVPVLVYYVPVLILIGAFTGLLNGFLAKLVCKHVKRVVGSKEQTDLQTKHDRSKKDR